MSSGMWHRGMMTSLHGFITQKTTIWIFTAVKPSIPKSVITSAPQNDNCWGQTVALRTAHTSPQFYTSVGGHTLIISGYFSSCYYYSLLEGLHVVVQTVYFEVMTAEIYSSHIRILAVVTDGYIFFQSLRASGGLNSKINHDHFLPYPCLQ
jgi:hypothetical protein